VSGASWVRLEGAQLRQGCLFCMVVSLECMPHPSLNTARTHGSRSKGVSPTAECILNLLCFGRRSHGLCTAITPVSDNAAAADLLFCHPLLLSLQA
jgi:hypothetical protein